MAPVRGDRVSRGVNARADVPTLVDRALQRHVEQVSAGFHHQPEVAHGGETGFERRARVDRATQRPVGRVVLYSVQGGGQAFRTSGPADEQVELHVHQPGQQGRIAEVYHVGRITLCAFGIDRGDPVSRHDHLGRGPDQPRVDVDPPSGPQNGHGTGSDTQSNVEAPESGTRGCFQHSTGNDTMIME